MGRRPRGYDRYIRQLSLPGMGIAGQQKLGGSSILVVGAGGLGSSVLLYLAAAGVGHITVADGDVVTESNLNRQILYNESSLGAPKAFAASQQLRRLNSAIGIGSVADWLTEANADRIITGYDAVVLCLDAHDVKMAANRACVDKGIPFVEGGVSGFHGTVTTVIPFETACYACTHDGLASAKRETPVLGAMAGLVGCAQALAVIRLLLRQPDPSRGVILCLDGLAMVSEAVPTERSPICPACARQQEPEKGNMK